MNKIDEFIEIIEFLKDNSDFRSICEIYQIKNHIVLSQNHRMEIARTLNEHSDVVYLDKEDGKWKLVSNKPKETKQAQVIPAYKGKTLSLEEIQEILKNAPEINAEKYDGAYVWMKEAIKEYAKLKDFSQVNIDDMNFIFGLSLGTWKMSVLKKKERLERSHLSAESKAYLSKLIDDIWNNAKVGGCLYGCENPNPVFEKPQVGMFGSGFMVYHDLSNEDARAFIKMCADIVNVDDENEIYNICSKTLNDDFVGDGLKVPSASPILHLIKPDAFPIINGNDGNGTIYGLLDIKLNNPKSLRTYIENCRTIKRYRDTHYPFKNYRIMDVAVWPIEDPKFDLRWYLEEHGERK